MCQKILILDDDTSLLETLAILLEDNGYEVKALSSGEKVIESINEFNPGLVLMDVMLAGLDGLTICRTIKNHDGMRDLPVILISGHYDLERALSHQGAPNDFLAKPFDLDVLLTKIKQQLDKAI
ncbi:response regulator [Mucilaginibacter gotjawali]|uniref:DNA-binding response regulator MtrA n=2 Tax=Mucilaginibacter gotjawali TaxID=1550579 RepID=A0A0X8X1P5_9SPHI|nr:response regulator [Mucilaginibacter gotjawali]MBB3056137.1 DNA-binding response OmpR family regulator [Mucilaginibacter gotjawali]BAU53523.1 DNA-binding response regulator MtrA [Mucilaginibacter gotjawali]